MNLLEPPDFTLFQSAQECLKMGNHAGAALAVQQISPESREHPDVLEIVWEIQANAQEWEAALATAQMLTQITPDNPYGWMYQACSLSELKRHVEAYPILETAAAKFPDVPMIPYNLACCACKLRRRTEASKWLSRAVEVGGRAEVKLMALDDPDLAPLLDEICAM